MDCCFDCIFCYYDSSYDSFYCFLSQRGVYQDDPPCGNFIDSDDMPMYDSPD